MKDWEQELHIYRLTPAPPEREDLQEFIDLYFTQNNERYIAEFLHFYEQVLNTVAMGIVQRYAMYGHFADLKAVCVFAIWEALQSYDPAGGVPFLKYKTRIMWVEIHDYVRAMRSGFTVDSPKVYRDLRKIMWLYEQKKSTETISKAVGLSEKRVQEMLAGGLRNMALTDFYATHCDDENGDESIEDVTRDDRFEPCQELLRTERHDTLFDTFNALPYREREVIRAHLGFCDKCHSTHGKANRPQTFYEIAIDHELFSAEAVERIYARGLAMLRKIKFDTQDMPPPSPRI